MRTKTAVPFQLLKFPAPPKPAPSPASRFASKVERFCAANPRYAEFLEQHVCFIIDGLEARSGGAR